MAAPHVAGVVALLWSKYPALRGNVGLTEAFLEWSATHLVTTTPPCGTDGLTQVPNNVYGYGRIDALAAYKFVPFQQFLPVVAQGGPVG
jgi:hypothetical protein